MSTSCWGCQDDTFTTEGGAYKKGNRIRPRLFKPNVQDMLSDPLIMGELGGRGFELLGVSSEEDDRGTFVQKTLRDGEADAP